MNSDQDQIKVGWGVVVMGQQLSPGMIRNQQQCSMERDDAERKGPRRIHEMRRWRVSGTDVAFTPWPPGSPGPRLAPRWAPCLLCCAWTSCACACGGCPPPHCHAASCCCCNKTQRVSITASCDPPVNQPHKLVMLPACPNQGSSCLLSHCLHFLKSYLP